MPDLIQTGGVPRLRDQLGVRERIFELDLPDHRRMHERLAIFAARLLNAIGAYRTPDENGFVYMVITRAGWAQ